jgi:hypothetical protein
LLALYTKLGLGGCLTHVGREGPDVRELAATYVIVGEVAARPVGRVAVVERAGAVEARVVRSGVGLACVLPLLDVAGHIEQARNASLT